jgi:predicted AlkP superfamily pyrophosphatase or phosphodiesterase
MRRATFLLIICCLLSPLAWTADVPAKDRIVLLISIDGLPGWAFEDPKLPVPTLRRMAAEGAFAKAMTASNPSVTWPNHTTMVTGVPPAKHGVLYNGLLVRQGPTSPPKVDPGRDKSELVRAVTVYDLARKAGLTTAQVDWVAIQNASTITWEFPEIPSPKGRVEQELIAAGVLTASDVQDFRKANITWRDQIWTRAAAHIIEKHKPNLLLFHLLNLDSTHHRYGPRTLASYSAIAFADSRVGEILDALSKAGLKDRATVFVVSDHGFKTIHRSIRPNAVLREQGQLKTAYAVPEGGIAMLYVTDPEQRARLVPRLKEIFRGMEGIDRILEPRDYAAFGFPDPASNDQMADLVLAAKTGYGFAASQEGKPLMDIAPSDSIGQHGYLSTDPEMDATFLAWGYGIRSGVRLDRVSNTDIAPTIAALLGLQMDRVTGKELRSILK